MLQVVEDFESEMTCLTLKISWTKNPQTFHLIYVHQTWTQWQDVHYFFPTLKVATLVRVTIIVSVLLFMGYSFTKKSGSPHP